MLDWRAIQARLREIEDSLDQANERVTVVPTDVRAALAEMEAALRAAEDEPGPAGGTIQTATVAVLETKFNPYHDEAGRFTSEGGGTFVSLFGKPQAAASQPAKPVVGVGKLLPSEATRTEYANQRAAMIKESESRMGAIDQRMREAQKTYDAQGDKYMQAAEFQRQTIMADTEAFDKLDRAYSQRADAKTPEQLAVANMKIKDLEDNYARTQKDREWVDKQMTRVIGEFSQAEQTYRNESLEVRIARANVNEEMRHKYVDAPEGPGSLGIHNYKLITNPTTGETERTLPDAGRPPEMWQQGMQAVNQITGNVLPPGSSIDMRPMPKEDPWFASGRSYHSGGVGASGYTGMITMHPNDSRISTTVHETGHAIEAQVPGMTDAIWQHIESRTTGETNRKLSEITGGNYGDGEVAKPDSFDSAYMGKDYTWNGKQSASEFLSMSMQKMYEDPVGFAQRDPQSFDFAKYLLANARANGGKIVPE